MVIKSKIYPTEYIIYVNMNDKEHEIFNCSLFEYADCCDSAEEFEEAVTEDFTDELQNTEKFTNEEIQEIMQSEKMQATIAEIVRGARNW